jgi:hypothetical protein
MASDKSIIKKHYAKIGAKGGAGGKGSERRRLACRLAAAVRWGNEAKIAEARRLIQALPQE